MPELEVDLRIMKLGRGLLTEYFIKAVRKALDGVASTLLRCYPFVRRGRSNNLQKVQR